MRAFNYCWFFFFLILNQTAYSSGSVTYVGLFGSQYISPPQSTREAACQVMIQQTGSSRQFLAAGGLASGDSGNCLVTDGTINSVYGSWQKRITADPNAGNQCGTTSVSGVEYPKIINTSGECVSIINADGPAMCKHLSQSTRFGKVNVSFTSEGQPIQPPPIVQGGCEGTVLSVQHCKHPPVKETGGVSLSPAPASCQVAINFTGNFVGGDNPTFVNPNDQEPGICPPGQTCEPPVPPDVTDKQPCTYTYDGEGRQVCSSTNFHGKPGQYSYCGTVNGQFGCVGQQPTSNGIKIDTTVSTQQNQDGTSTTTKTDTYQNVKCTGIGSCTTTTNKSTQITVTNGSGQTVSENTTCTGPNCSSGGAAGEGDGDGDGVDDCVKTNSCQEEGGGGPSDWYEAGEDTYASVIGNFAQEVQTLPVTSGVTNFLTFTPSGACPVYEVNAWVFNIRLDQWCTGTTIPWDLIKAVILGCCAFLAFRIAFL